MTDKTKTSEEMLRELVQGAIAGGWKENHELWSSRDRDNRGVDLIVIRTLISENFVEREYDYYSYSLPDLLADRSFMIAAMGEEMIDTCDCKVHVFPEDFSHSKLPAWQYHALEALKLLQDGENAIKYLYEHRLHKKE